MRFIPIVLISGAAASQLGATDCGNAISDTGFDLWCGTSLCSWKTERGDIQQAPTWNEGDLGVELVGDDVAIEQVSPVDSSDGNCITFTVIADIDPDVEVDLNVDVLGDGTIESTERLPAANWKPLSYQIAVKSPFAGIRFELAKQGAGHAVLANIGAVVTACDPPADAIDAQQRPLGAPCGDGSDCASGLCGIGELPPPFALDGSAATPVCVGCDPDHPCGAGDTCGTDEPVSPLRAAPTDCVPVASRAFGEQCGVDAECAQGYCTGSVCSTCNQTSGCTGDETCLPASGDLSLPGQEFPPWECAPDQHARQSGEPCEQDTDCASNTCVGTARSECPDGRRCVNDAECPFGLDVGDPLQNGPCLPNGLQGGSCQ